MALDQTVVGGFKGDCLKVSTSSYLRQSGKMRVTFNYNDFMNEPTCEKIVSPEELGYVADTDGNYITHVLSITPTFHEGF